LPGRITAEINPHDLVIAVAQVTHPAQEVTEVNQAGQRSSIGQKAYVVVTVNCVHQFFRQAPMLAEHLPRLAMSKAQNLFLDDMDGDVLLGGEAEAFSKLLGVKDRVHQKPEVVQQSGQVRFFGLRDIRFSPPFFG
jgi:hypothetical protein